SLPRSMAILGGGFIAAEFAHIFSALGVDVTVITRGPAMLRDEDADISEAFTTHARQRWDVRLNTQVAAAQHHNITTIGNNANPVRLQLTDGTKIDAELLLVATGRITNTDRLNVEAAGITTHPDGRIAADG